MLSTTLVDNIFYSGKVNYKNQKQWVKDCPEEIKDRKFTGKETSNEKLHL